MHLPVLKTWSSVGGRKYSSLQAPVAFFYVKLLLSFLAMLSHPQLQFQGCRDKMVITAEISSSSDSDTLQRSSPCPVDHQVVDLVLVSCIGGAPDELMDFMIWEECLSDDQIVCREEFK